ncbi:hypothetical protein HAZT_HAZT008992 [Hyalella azteca]|uniref:Uncharacterized protein n=1 Tax=Hyalella azteca TaxID=294128 RepID=A0A6A0GVP1_HYAAZ|nr:hypothetical protein HAZT_HAZT008992 [Hyalella azteca]
MRQHVLEKSLLQHSVSCQSRKLGGGNLGGGYEGIKRATGPTPSKTAPLKSKTGEVLADQEGQMRRWTEHYLELKLDGFHMRCFRRILEIKWQDRVHNSVVLERSNMISLLSVLSERRLKWLGHVSGMGKGRIPKDLLYGELAEARRKTGRPKLRLN